MFGFGGNKIYDDLERTRGASRKPPMTMSSLLTQSAPLERILIHSNDVDLLSAKTRRKMEA
jgi:hypothetical protein